SWGLTGDRSTAVIEMATASGLALLKPLECNPLITSTVGTGELIRAALRQGVNKILIGIGGSATNDGGMGMARALGVRFLDRRGRELPEGGGALRQLARIDMQGLERRLLEGVDLELACDVTNPLTGPRGASAVYGPQKGATPRMVAQLDAGLQQLAAIIQRDIGIDVEKVPGAGAAGGLGAGLLAFLGARPRSGVQIIMEVTDLPRRLRGCDLVITGEGRLDVQTISGKAPGGVAKAAKTLGIPVIALCGSVAPDAGAVLKLGIDAYFSALEQIIPESELPVLGPGMLERCAAQVGRLLAFNLRNDRGIQKKY
ncbi:MAG: glycerate kinase, partial [Phycisphaerae bacterium]